MLQLQSVLGVFALLAIAWALSENRRLVSLKGAALGLGVTFALAFVLMKSPWLAQAVGWLNAGVEGISQATRAGTSFVFGYVGGGDTPFEVANQAASFSLAFQALPVVLVMSALTTLLFHWRILQPVVRAFALALERTMGIGGAVGLSTAANIFLGMVEAPLFIKPYLARLTRSEMFMVMTGGMAGIAGTVFVLYAAFLRPVIPDASGHLLIASILGAPAALLIARIMVPEMQTPSQAHQDADIPPVARNSMDAIVRGTAAGLELLWSIIAMIIVLVALVWIANALLGLLPDIMGAKLTLQRMLGWIMSPVCWLMGVPWAEAATAGSLMGVKTVLNELLAYLELANLPEGTLSDRSRLIMVYALCGFANFGSLGIMIAGLAGMCPERRDEIIALGGKSLVSGTLTTCLMGAMAGILQ
ncbi:MAG: nucleoside:proton symporter [Alphaproteobacteria bacterium]|nr:nucleoside:proton symporter [Alphaproteobacteria bacterium]